MHNESRIIHFKSIAQLHQLIGIAKPKHPLFSIIRFEDIPKIQIDERLKLISDFYQITLKKECPCKMQYGQNSFDFDEGIISCFAPKQVTIIHPDFAFAADGWILSVHPDFLRIFSLSQKIKNYGFFDYAVHEALILSEDEQHSIENIFNQIESEYLRSIDHFSQDLIIAHLEVLLSYCNRYYSRQFITRQAHNHEIVVKVEQILNNYYRNKNETGLPTTTYLAAALNLSPKYLSDCLKQAIGRTAQQLIHEKLIEQAKDYLLLTELSVSEIAYQLGFEYPQSFNKLFKNKTSQTPNEFKRSFN